MSRAGSLVLVGTPIGNLSDLTPRAVEVLRDADLIAAEDTRRTRALLTHAGVAAHGRLVAVHARNEREAVRRVVDKVRSGALVAYVTDAGMPGISDPGERLVRGCLEAGLSVGAVPGPSALITALVLSGLPAGRFVFEGFLPRKGRDRTERLAAIAAEARTVVLYESPHRVAATLADLAAAVGENRAVAVARELTKVFEEVWRGPVGAAARRGDTVEPRGEHVIVVGPAPDTAEPDDDAVVTAVGAALGRGVSARDAASEVARSLGVSRRRAYAAAVASKRAGAGPSPG